MSHTMAWLRIASLLTLGLAAGCSKSSSGPGAANSGSSSAPSQSAASGPCSLVTQAEVESALGAGATMTGDTNPRTGMRECRFKLPNGTELDELVMVIQSTNNQSWDVVKKTFMEDKKVKEVPGIGDDALNVGGYAGIWARKGDKYVQIFGSMKPERDEKAEIYLLQRAVSRL